MNNRRWANFMKVPGKENILLWNRSDRLQLLPFAVMIPILDNNLLKCTCSPQCNFDTEVPNQWLAELIWYMQEVMKRAIFVELVDKKVLSMHGTIANQLCYICVMQLGDIWNHFYKFIRHFTGKHCRIYFLHGKNLWQYINTSWHIGEYWVEHF